MAEHGCETCIVTCIDYRLQEYINNWIAQNFEPGSFDRVALAGGVKNLEVILDQAKTSSRLHNIRRAILINHEDCGAYGAENIPDQETELKRHTEDLKSMAERIKSELPDLNVESYFLRLDGTFEPV